MGEKGQHETKKDNTQVYDWCSLFTSSTPFPSTGFCNTHPFAMIRNLVLFPAPTPGSNMGTYTLSLVAYTARFASLQ